MTWVYILDQTSDYFDWPVHVTLMSVYNEEIVSFLVFDKDMKP